MTFPFLADASQIFGVLMGQDVTLVRYDAGTLRRGRRLRLLLPADPDRARAGARSASAARSRWTAASRWATTRAGCARCSRAAPARSCSTASSSTTTTPPAKRCPRSRSPARSTPRARSASRSSRSASAARSSSRRTSTSTTGRTRTGSCGSRRSSASSSNPICLFVVVGQDRRGALGVRRDRPVLLHANGSRSRSSV